MRTLFVRVHRSSATALALAKHFEAHDKVSVLYPGLESHPGHEIARSQMHGGFGGMLSIRHRDGEAAAMETAARVTIFKRATSLGGVESLIEHRASIEGPSSPLPGDLLRLSVGLESLDDLINDLEQALDHDVGDKAVSVAVQPAPGRIDATDPVAAIEHLLATKVRILLADRGCELELAHVRDGTVSLRINGSPGGVLPVRVNIENLLRHYVPHVSHLVFVHDTHQEHGSESVKEQVQRILDEQVNPAVRAHAGVVHLVGVDDGVATVRLEGRCQGCAMANVTIRQGVEVMITEHVPAIVSVTDATDHPAGSDPYFKTKKGGR